MVNSTLNANDILNCEIPEKFIYLKYLLSTYYDLGIL